MKKPATAAATAVASLTVPSSYAFDDTPKAFKRMLQRKNNDQEAYKKSKQQQADHFTKKRSVEPSSKSADNNQKRVDNSPSLSSQSSQSSKFSVTTNTQPLSLANGFKTVRAKRKVHLQSRDLKKKLKRFDATRELPFHPSNTRKDVRDVVQEPPKLHQPKKTFKKVRDEREELKSWSDYEDELEAEGAAVEKKQKNFKKNK